MKRYIFLEELQKCPAPPPLPFGVNMVGPVIYTFGNEQQKQHFLPRIANMDDWWCQGFSEPGAGSDLASLKATARRRAIPISSMARRRGPRSRNMRTGSSVSRRTDPDAKKQSGISFISSLI